MEEKSPSSEISPRERLHRLVASIRDQLQATNEKFTDSDAVYYFIPVDGDSPLGGHPEAAGLSPKIMITDYRTMHWHKKRDTFGVNSQVDRRKFYEEIGPDGQPANLPILTVSLVYETSDGRQRDFEGEEIKGGGLIFRPCDIIFDEYFLPNSPINLGLEGTERESTELIFRGGDDSSTNAFDDPLIQAIEAHLAQA